MGAIAKTWHIDLNKLNNGTELTNLLTFSSLSSPKKCINKNDDLATTPTSIANNNIDTPLTNEVIKVVAIDEREKRDRSTEKQLIIGEDEIIIIAADSLENLRSDEVAADLKNEEEVIMAEDDEGLGDINHGSEASR